MKHILILGDSHVSPFKNKSTEHFEFTVVSSVGASAQGLTNINSKTKGLQNTINFFEKNQKNFDYVILHYGEVDCNATIWFYKEKYNQTLEEALMRSINNYKAYIKKYIEPNVKNAKILLFSPILPTVQDGYINKGKLRKNIFVNQKDRTLLTQKFDIELRKLEYKTLSLNSKLINDSTGVIDLKYVKNPSDHHLDTKVSFKMWNELLSTLNI